MALEKGDRSTKRKFAWCGWWRERWGGGNLVLFSLLLIVPCGSLGEGGEEGQPEFPSCLLPINFYSRTDANKENPTV